jgi:hypothetical protein
VQRELGTNYVFGTALRRNSWDQSPAQIRRNAPIVPDNLFLPTFSAHRCAHECFVDGPSLADFQCRSAAYAVDKFVSSTAFDPASSTSRRVGRVHSSVQFSWRVGNGVFQDGIYIPLAIDDATNELNTSQVNPRRPDFS